MRIPFGLITILTAVLSITCGMFEVRGQTGLCSGPAECLDQGWSEHERSWWYSVSQGSRLLPLSWMLALEQADNAQKFLSDTNVDNYRYLTNPISRDNPYGLPVGFAVDKEEGVNLQLMCAIFKVGCARESLRTPWVGLNCAACHTNELSFRGRRFRIEGAPTHADFQGFHEDLLKSLTATSTNAEKFSRFAAAVLGASTTAERLNALKLELDEQIAWKTVLQRKNGTAMRYGHGRLDAQGHILNKISLVVGATDQLMGFPSDAPASYPFIWNAPQHDKVQWNGIAENKFKFEIFGRQHDIGALVRNTAEVLGVFAHIDVTPKDTSGYASSLRLGKMIDLERQLGRLHSPKWPEHILGDIDREKAAAGERLFVAKCAGCHLPLDSTDTKKLIKAEMQLLPTAGTDIWTACNTYLHQSKAGLLDGKKQFVYAGDAIKPVDQTRFMLAHVSIASIVGRADELAGKIIDDTFGRGEEIPSIVVAPQREYLPGTVDSVKKARAKECLETSNSILAYKARPLNGIWATAPYLHNGSVPTLYDLLLPSEIRSAAPPLEGEASPASAGPKRPETFHVGGRQFDANKVGVLSVQGPATSEFRVRGPNGAPILGNYNSGHEGSSYGTSDLSEEQRRALVEYLKTL
jgi:hypothetical protein